jgi:cobaltochelatase CobN
MIRADRFVAPPSELTEYVFNYYDWDVRPRSAEATPASPVDLSQSRIALLSHADTDLLALRRARPILPDGLETIGASLLRLQSEEQLSLLLDGDLASARVVILRLHGELEGVPGFARLRDWARLREIPLVIVSGTGEPRADFARVSTAPLDIVDGVRTYLTIGGDRNAAECMKFVADRLLLTGYGSAPPIDVPEHGVYVPDLDGATIADWQQRADSSRPTAAVLFYRAHLTSGNLAFVDGLIAAIEDRGLNALAVFTSSLRAADGKCGNTRVPLRWRSSQSRRRPDLDVVLRARRRRGLMVPSALERIGTPVIRRLRAGCRARLKSRGLTALEPRSTSRFRSSTDGSCRCRSRSRTDLKKHRTVCAARRADRSGRRPRRSIARLRHLPRPWRCAWRSS